MLATVSVCVWGIWGVQCYCSASLHGQYCFTLSTVANMETCQCTDSGICVCACFVCLCVCVCVCVCEKDRKRVCGNVCVCGGVCINKYLCANVCVCVSEAKQTCSIGLRPGQLPCIGCQQDRPWRQKHCQRTQKEAFCIVIDPTCEHTCSPQHQHVCTACFMVLTNQL